jgi:hypothetical protein
MIATRYRTDLPGLVAVLTSSETLQRYQEALAEEHKITAERAMADFQRRMSLLASRALAHGFDTLARHDRVVADALLTDLFAVATYHHWELPIEDLGESDLDISDLPRGLLGVETLGEGASLWQLDGSTIAFARCRAASDEAAMDNHPRAN